jgi:hypothetical protein
MVEQETGVVLIVIGVILIVAGLFLPFVCGIGIILVIVGVILAVVSQPRPVYYAAPGPYPYGTPTAPTAPATTPPCPVCGQPLMWIAQYGRWWCGYCQQYR